MKAPFAAIFISLSIVNVPFASETAVHVPDVINRVALLASGQNQSQAIELLEQIQTFDDWSMGGGLGPADKTYMTLLALKAFEAFLPWNKPEAKQIGLSPTSQIQRWMRADATSSSEILAMLTSESPTARWIACEKIKNTGSVSPDILPTLRDIALNDNYFGISRSPEDRGDMAPPRAHSGHIFVALLRSEAIVLLNMAGKADVKVDQERLSREGLAWLGKQYVARASENYSRIQLEDALGRLEPLIPEIAEAQKREKPDLSAEAQLALFQSLAKITPADGSSKDSVSVAGGGPDSPMPPATKARQAPYGLAQSEASATSQPTEAHSWWPWLSGAVAVLMLGIGTFYYSSKK